MCISYFYMFSKFVNIYAFVFIQKNFLLFDTVFLLLFFIPTFAGVSWRRGSYWSCFQKTRASGTPKTKARLLRSHCVPWQCDPLLCVQVRCIVTEALVGPDFQILMYAQFIESFVWQILCHSDHKSVDCLTWILHLLYKNSPQCVAVACSGRNGILGGIGKEVWGPTTGITLKSLL